MKNTYKIFIMTFIALLGTSCNDWLDTAPEQSLSDDLAFSTPSTARAILVGAYSSLTSRNYYGRDFVASGEMMSDNVKAPVAGSGRLETHATNDERSHIGDAGFWTSAYAMINRLNLFIANIDGVAGMEADEKQQLMGEAKFLRGLVYFDLVRAYGRNPNHLVENFDLGVPLLLTPFDGLDDDAFPTRASVSDVYTQVKADLTDAISDLDDSKAPYWASKSAAQALLGRVHLYLGEWQSAIDRTSEALAATSASLALGDGTTEGDSTAYTEIFADQTESLFAVKFTVNESTDGNNNSLAVLYVGDDVGGSNGGYGDAIVRQDLLNQYTVGDVRNFMFADGNISGEPVTYNLKFYHYGGGTGIDDIPVIRFSELLLNRAEAYAMVGGQNTNALADVNQIRSRAGLTDFIDDANLLTNILAERRRELAFEGHRYFDLKRRGLAIPKGVDGVDCQTCLILYEDYRVVGAIAQAELDVNPNLVNNPGYSDN